MYDLLNDLGGYGNSYYEADKSRMAKKQAAKRLHSIVSNEVQKEIARQEEKFIDRTIQEIQIYFDNHPLNI